MKGALIVLVVLIVGAVIIIGPLISSRNELVTERNDIDARWAQVDNDMKRRADLIPNLVKTVRGAMDFELVAAVSAEDHGFDAHGGTVALARGGRSRRRLGWQSRSVGRALIARQRSAPAVWQD